MDTQDVTVEIFLNHSPASLTLKVKPPKPLVIERAILMKKVKNHTLGYCIYSSSFNGYHQIYQ
jgi:hypothetical protein